MNNVLVLPYPSKIERVLVIKLFWLVTLSAIIIVFAFYLFQVIAVQEQRFILKASREKISELSQVNKSLEIRFFQTYSLKNIEEMAQSSSFEKATKIHYIRVLDRAVVTK